MTALDNRIKTARQALDTHVRDMMHWHFSDNTGCPFWLERVHDLGFDPLREISTYSDLALFGYFQDEWLRGGPVRRWVPKAYMNERICVFETGGSTGLPKYRINFKDFQTDYEQYSSTLPKSAFPLGADWLMLGPTGPRRLRLAIEHLAQHRGGICFHVDLDPRWVNRLVVAAKMHELAAYKDHVVDQALKILKAHDQVRCVFTTPKLLEALSQKISLSRLGITGIFCGGTEMNAQFHRFAREELVPGIEFVPTYGNTLMGLACYKPFISGSGDYAITYYAPQPRAVIELVDPQKPEHSVEYGETGRVMLTTLTREFFMPRFLERDEAERAEPIASFPWDGVRDLRLLHQLEESVVVGVY